MKKVIFFILLAVAELIYSVSLIARTDTLRVMTYNVLYYGNGCQGPKGKAAPPASSAQGKARAS